MRIASLIAYGLICVPGFIIGLPMVMHLVFWPFDHVRWPVNLMMFLADLAVVAAIVTRYKKELKCRKWITWVAFILLCVPIVHVYLFTKGDIMKSPFFVLPSLAFVVMYVWSLVKPSVKAGKVFQKDCCKEA